MEIRSDREGGEEEVGMEEVGTEGAGKHFESDSLPVFGRWEGRVGEMLVGGLFEERNEKPNARFGTRFEGSIFVSK